MYERIKVLIIAHYCVVFEYQKKLEELARYKDIDLTLIVPWSWQEGARDVRLEKTHSQSYKIIPVRIIRKNHISSYIPPLLFKYIFEIKPDILHIEEEPFSICALYATVCAKLIKAKVIFYTFENILRRYKFPLNLIDRYVLEAADCGICASVDSREVLRQRGFKKEIHILPLVGVDENLFKQLDKDSIKKKYNLEGVVIGYVGRFVKEKGIFTLLRACQALKKDYEFKLLLIGDGELKEKIIMYAQEIDIKERILIKPAMPAETLIYYLNCIDILVLPSQTQEDWREQFGRVLPEAMSCGVAVVGSTCGAIPEVIADAGLIFKEKSHQDLEEKLRLLLSNKTLLKNLAAKGITRVHHNFTNKVIASSIYKIYKNII